MTKVVKFYSRDHVAIRVNVGQSDASCGHMTNLTARTSGLDRKNHRCVSFSEGYGVARGGVACSGRQAMQHSDTARLRSGRLRVAEWFESA